MSSSNDAKDLQSFNYKQELRRTLKMFSSFAVAFSFISITTGIFTNYSFVLNASGPVGIWAWPVVTLGHLLVAAIFAELAGRIPLSGYSYQWLTRIANPGLGWFAGWICFCFLMIVVPTVDFGLAPIFAEMVGLEPTMRVQVVIVLVTLSIQALINIFGVKLATMINNIAVYTEVIGMVGVIIVLGIIVALFGHADWGMLASTGEALASGGSFMGVMLLAALMGSYTLVGFEAAANLSEETINAKKNVPKAMILAVILSGGIGTLFLIIVSVSITDLGTVVASANPIPYILEAQMGSFVSGLFLILVIISIFACGLVIMASGSRLIYAMSRDDVFYGAGLFKKVSPKTGVPIFAILLVYVLGCLAAIFSGSLTLLVGSASVLPAAIYLTTIAAYAWKNRTLPPSDTFSLGKWRTSLLTLAILWLIFEIGYLTIPAQFHKVTVVSAVLLALGVVIYFASFRKRILSGEIGIKGLGKNPNGPVDGQDFSL